MKIYPPLTAILREGEIKLEYYTKEMPVHVVLDYMYASQSMANHYVDMEAWKNSKRSVKFGDQKAIKEFLASFVISSSSIDPNKTFDELLKSGIDVSSLIDRIEIREYECAVGGICEMGICYKGCQSPVSVAVLLPAKSEAKEGQDEFEKVWISACKQTLADIKLTFESNLHRAETENDKVVFQAIVDTIERFPLPKYKNSK